MGRIVNIVNSFNSLTVLGVLIRIISNAISKASKSEDYPGSTKFGDARQENKLDTRFSDISDVYKENDIDTERQDKVIFEEIISNVTFRYDEKTKILTIGEKYDTSNEQPIKVKLNSLADLGEFVDRLEEYVDE